MPELTATIFRDFLAGSWTGKVSKNGNFEREIIFNWPKAFGKFSAVGIEDGVTAPPNAGTLDDTKQVSIAGWQSDTRRWRHIWYNEFGGFGELQWTSQNVVNGINVLYGFGHECKQESDDPTEHILMCEMYDKDNFKYTIQSFKKGILEIVATRIKTSEELKEILEKQADGSISFSELSGI